MLQQIENDLLPYIYICTKQLICQIKLVQRQPLSR